MPDLESLIRRLEADPYDIGLYSVIRKELIRKGYSSSKK